MLTSAWLRACRRVICINEFLSAASQIPILSTTEPITWTWRWSGWSADIEIILTKKTKLNRHKMYLAKHSQQSILEVGLSFTSWFKNCLSNQIRQCFESFLTHITQLPGRSLLSSHTLRLTIHPVTDTPGVAVPNHRKHPAGRELTGLYGCECHFLPGNSSCQTNLDIL